MADPEIDIDSELYDFVDTVGRWLVIAATVLAIVTIISQVVKWLS